MQINIFSNYLKVLNMGMQKHRLHQKAKMATILTAHSSTTPNIYRMCSRRQETSFSDSIQFIIV